jgi:hypothetical protein
MIGWRYHLISIVAVFLALGLGLLMGTALLNDRLVDNLQRGNERQQQQLNEVRIQLDVLTSFADQVVPFLAEDRLVGQGVVVVTHDGADEAALADVRRALELTGADVIATLSVRPGLTSPSAAEQRILGEILDVPLGASQDDAASIVAEALAERLATGPIPGTPEDADLLGQLLSEGFVIAGSELDSTTQVGGEDQALVFVAGGPEAASPAATDALMPLIDELSRLDVVLVVGERSTSAAGVVQVVRRDVDAIGPLVTIDDLELPAGAAALILGLDRALLTRQGGHYGIGEDADQLLPAA